MGVWTSSEPLDRTKACGVNDGLVLVASASLRLDVCRPGHPARVAWWGTKVDPERFGGFRVVGDPKERDAIDHREAAAGPFGCRQDVGKQVR